MPKLRHLSAEARLERARELSRKRRQSRKMLVWKSGWKGKAWGTQTSESRRAHGWHNEFVEGTVWL